MNSDFELKTTLTADGSQLADAMRKAEKDTQSYQQSVSAGAAVADAAMAANTAALNALTVALSKAAKEAKDQQVAAEASASALTAQAEATKKVAAASGQMTAATTSAAEVATAAAAAAQANVAALTAQASAVHQVSTAEAQLTAATTETASVAATASAAAHTNAAAMTAQADAVRKVAAANVQLTAASAASTANLQKAGISAGQTAQAMRQLPMQFTDIVVSLQAGQAPLTVLLQQGGQIKDTFGGIGPAFSAIRAAISPMIVVTAGLAAGVGLLAMSYLRGRAEAEAYTRAIVMSGNAAGTTNSQLASMAERVSDVVGSQAQAANVLARLTATGEVANASLEGVAATTLRVEKVIGQSVADTVKQFEDLGRKPLETSVLLNQSYHYLTLATYERIKSLQEQKRYEDAGELAQKAYSEAMDKRAAKIEASLGSLQRTWMSVETAAAKAWSAMLNVGREDTLAKKIEQAQAEVDNAKRRGNEPAKYNAASGRMMPGSDEQLKAAEARLATLKVLQAAEVEAAKTEAAEAAKVEAGIRSSDDADKERKAREAAAIAAIKSRLEAITGAYGDAEKILETQHQAALLSDADYWQGKRNLIALTEKAELAALAQQSDVLAKQKAFGADRITLNSQIAQNTAAAARVVAKASTDTVIANAQEAASVTALKRAQAEYVRQLQETADARDRQQARELAVLGRGDQARGLAGKQNGLEDRYLQQRQQLDSDRLANRLKEPEYQARLAELNSFHQQALAREVDYQRQISTAQEDGTLGMTRALENYLDSARNVAGQTESLFTNAFKGMEDGIVQFAMTGKLNFASFAESVIADLVRIYVRQQLAGFVTNVFNGSDLTVNSTDFSPMTSGGQELPTRGGLAGGGSAIRGSIHPVNEKGPELLTVDGRDYLMMGSRSGTVTPNDRSLMPVAASGPAAAGAAGTGGGVSITMPVTVQNNTGTPMKATTQRRADGGFDVILDALEAGMAANVAAGSGPLARSFEGRYGLRSALSSV